MPQADNKALNLNVHRTEQKWQEKQLQCQSNSCPCPKKSSKLQTHIKFSLYKSSSIRKYLDKQLDCCCLRKVCLTPTVAALNDGEQWHMRATLNGTLYRGVKDPTLK